MTTNAPEPTSVRSTESRQVLENLVRILDQILNDPTNDEIDGARGGYLANVDGISGERAMADALPSAVVRYIEGMVLKTRLGDPYGWGATWIEARKQRAFRDPTVESWMYMLARSVLDAIEHLTQLDSEADDPGVHAHEDLADAIFYNWAQLKAVAVVGSQTENGGLAGYAMMSRPDIHALVEEALTRGFEVLVPDKKKAPVHKDNLWICDMLVSEVVERLQIAVKAAKQAGDAMSRVR